MASAFQNDQEQANGAPPLAASNQLWTPNQLLNPRAGAVHTDSPKQPSASDSNNSAQEDVIFQFSTPNDNAGPSAQGLGSPHQSSDNAPFLRQHSMPTMAIFANGNDQKKMNLVSRQLERANNVQDRSDVPQPKRRRTQAEDDNPTPNGGGFGGGFGGGSGGILGDYVRMKAVEGKSAESASWGARNTAPPKHERHTEVITLDDTPSASTPKSEASTVDLTGGDSDTTKEQTEVDVCYGMIEGATINCHRVPAPKPGTVAWGGGNDYWPVTKVLLRRKADSKDSIITAYDYSRQAFGLLDAKYAGPLSRVIDSKMQIRTDCRIAVRRKRPGEQVGQPVSYNLAVELMVYGPLKFCPQVGRYLTLQNLKLISPLRVDAGVRVVNPHTKDGGLAAAGPRPITREPVTTYTHAPPVVRTAEEIRSEIVGVFDSLPKSEDLPEMEPNDLITTELLKHQRQALYFMTWREKGLTPTGDGSSKSMMSSYWQCKRDQYGQPYYYNVITDVQQREPPPVTRGGILADMMGLGKTLSILSLVTTTMGEARKWEAQEPIQPRAPQQKKPHQGPKHFEIPKPQNIGLTPLARNGRATLLVCPLSTIANWEEQIKQHVKAQQLSYIIYHGTNRPRDLHVLSQVDLVITTYGAVSTELTARTKQKRGLLPLEEIGWFRVVLDEAHIIREQQTLTFKAICRLQANRRWAVTGTPIQNKLEDFGSLLGFLRLSPFDEKTKFLQYIITPFKNADPEIVAKLRVLIDTITLRRLKNKINLPPKTDEVVKLSFSEEERAVYEPFAKNAKDRLTALTGRHDRIMGGRTYIHILRAILRLRLICAHGKDLLNDEDMEQLKGTSAATAIDLDSDDEETKAALKEREAYDMFYVMQQADGDKCTRCNRKIGGNDVNENTDDSERQDWVIGLMAPCYHLYCVNCANLLGRGPEESEFGCHICARVDKTGCVEITHSRADAEIDEGAVNKGKGKATGKVVDTSRYTGPHTKTRRLVEELLKNKQMSTENPTEKPYKSVVFSGWTSHLDLIEIALSKAGITFTRLDGKMTRVQRSRAMDEFRDNRDVQVILVSINAGGLGLNLTSANSAFVMEPQFNPAAEAQAVDRVHRLGQERPVRIVRFVMEDSFEEKMMELQEKKTKLANLSLDGRDKEKIMDRTEAARQRLIDLRTLFR